MPTVVSEMEPLLSKTSLSRKGNRAGHGCSPSAGRRERAAVASGDNLAGTGKCRRWAPLRHDPGSCTPWLGLHRVAYQWPVCKKCSFCTYRHVAQYCAEGTSNTTWVHVPKVFSWSTPSCTERACNSHSSFFHLAVIICQVPRCLWHWHAGKFLVARDHLLAQTTTIPGSLLL